MMKYRIMAIVTIVAAVLSAVIMLSSSQTWAVELNVKCRTGSYKGSDCDLVKDNRIDNNHETVTEPIMWAIWLLAIISIIVIIIGGFRYVTSQGDQTQMQSAKNTILYAVIGLIVAIAAYAIVSFVVTQFIETSATPATT